MLIVTCKFYIVLLCFAVDALAVCRAHQGLPAGFLLLRYSVLFTVESVSLLYLLYIYFDLYVLGNDALIS